MVSSANYPYARNGEKRKYSWFRFVKIFFVKWILKALFWWDFPVAEEVSFHPFAPQTFYDIVYFVPFSF